jgi:glucans biosynthesis protein C
LDWLRVIAVFLLLFYHSGMAFVAEWGWHLKNAETSPIFQEWMYFMARWRMALLFFVSGAGTWFVLKRASAGEYIHKRFVRLFVPLVFGILVIVPPQIYMERIANGAGYSSYLEFYPSVFQFRPYPEGNTSWHHLWFIAYLFLYSLLGLPLFLFLRSARGQNAVARFCENLTAWRVYLFGLPLAVIYAGLIVKFRGPQNLVDDWAMFFYFFGYFVFGFLFTLDTRFAELVEAKRQTSLRLGCFAYLVICYFRWNHKTPEFNYSVANMLYLALGAFNAWFWVLTFLGYGKRYLNRNHRFLSYANEAVYPFYILHQTVIVVIVYYVIQTKDTVLLKFLFASGASLAVTVILYHFLVKPYRPIRFLFGMQPAKTSS